MTRVQMRKDREIRPNKRRKDLTNGLTNIYIKRHEQIKSNWTQTQWIGTQEWPENEGIESGSKELASKKPTIFNVKTAKKHIHSINTLLITRGEGKHCKLTNHCIDKSITAQINIKDKVISRSKQHTHIYIIKII